MQKFNGNLTNKSLMEKYRNLIYLKYIIIKPLFENYD